MTVDQPVVFKPIDIITAKQITARPTENLVLVCVLFIINISPVKW